MADIELVIKIPKEAFELIKSDAPIDFIDAVHIISTIQNGIPLPKNHGRLGDLDALKKEMQNYLDDCAKTSEYTRLGFETAIAVVEDADTIIEADKGE